MSRVPEATQMEDKHKIKTEATLISIEDTVHILNKENARPFVPINETVFFYKLCDQFPKINLKQINKKQANKSLVEAKPDENSESTETRLLIKIKQKGRIEKIKLDLLNKKKLGDEGKEKLDRLRKITREIAQTLFKKNEHSVNDKQQKHCSFNDLNLKTTFHNSDILYHMASCNSLSKIHGLSTNMYVNKTVTGSSIQKFEQLINDEKLRAKQHLIILHLREKSVINRLKWEVKLSGVQIKNLKNLPSHEKQLQSSQQQRQDKINKLEYSLSQVKQLSSAIDSIYKQRLIMLEEYLQYLRIQS